MTSRTTRLISNTKQRARAIKREVHAVWLAARDPRTPWFVKALALVAAAYAVSPIDLIPDFIPVLGYVDDIIIVPLGIMLVVKLIPPEVMNKHRRAAANATEIQLAAWRQGYSSPSGYSLLPCWSDCFCDLASRSVTCTTLRHFRARFPQMTAVLRRRSSMN